jgi:hypothetical protein
MWVAIAALILAAALGFDVVAVARRHSDRSNHPD